MPYFDIPQIRSAVVAVKLLSRCPGYAPAAQLLSAPHAGSYVFLAMVKTSHKASERGVIYNFFVTLKACEQEQQAAVLLNMPEDARWMAKQEAQAPDGLCLRC